MGDLFQTGPSGKKNLHPQLQWASDYHGLIVQQVVMLGDACVVLLTDDLDLFEPALKNLICVNPNLTLRWVAEMPFPWDRYGEIRIENGKIKAGSYSGYAVVLDADTGKIESRIFTK